MTDIGNDGERATINGSWGYYAHLSIYHFAVPYATGRRVLDVGSGTGYGAAYLARHGASVLALDGSTEAVAYSRQRFAGDAVTYEVANLNKPLPLGDAVFDVVFSSNVFEHVEHIDGLIGECARVLAHDGLVIVAVPPINSAGSAENDMRNRFHVHHIPPWAWAAKLGRWFSDVECHGHVGDLSQAMTPPDQLTLREDDFEFPVLAPDDLQAHQSITAVFVCRGVRPAALPQALAEREPADWCFGSLAAGLIGEGQLEVRRLQAAVAGLHAQLAAERVACERRLADAERALGVMRSSTSWRATAPFRGLAGWLRASNTAE